MQTTNLIWQNGKLIPWAEAKVHVLTHSLHYGSAAFEGIRVYTTAKGPAIFQLDRHVDRLFYSAEALKMKMPWSKDEFKQAILDTVRANKVEACYIRPLVFYGYGELRVSPRGCPVEAIIAVWPWGAYISNDPIKIKVAKLIRIHPASSVTDAKITGHYVNSMLAGLEATDEGYQEALLLDYEGNIAEGPGENFFIVKNNVIITPKLGTILAGITRESVLALARNLGFKTEERAVKLDEIFTADECFFTGTAAEITAIGSVNDKPIKESFGPITKKLFEEFQKIIHGENEKYNTWLTYV